ncbi:unnamed protein product, partial [Discosporangium mesarthrocarpum]
MQSDAKDEGETGTLEELEGAVKETLDHNGVLGKIKAQIRAAVYDVLQGPSDGVLHPPMANDNLLINELIRDYMVYNRYDNALSVFLAESGQPNDRALDRTFLRDELGVTEDRTATEKMPLLYGIIDMLKRWRAGDRENGVQE